MDLLQMTKCKRAVCFWHVMIIVIKITNYLKFLRLHQKEKSITSYEQTVLNSS